MGLFVFVLGYPPLTLCDGSPGGFHPGFFRRVLFFFVLLVCVDVVDRG